jgi:hypothetical protein
MYELSRVRLYSVGPPGARYQDVLLDLSGAGKPVEHHQPSLLGLGGGPAARRPSPATVLFLENGGGKSVLIKLIFSVMLPGRRQVVGTTNTRVLEKFVMARDVGHVALEWVHVGTGQQLVTGKVSEWRGRVVSADPANLIDLWYCFHPSDGMSLDDLPFAMDGHLVSASGFRDRLTEAAAADPALDLYWTRRHTDWTDRLDLAGLDPELFRYQRAMNAGEGEAADAFAFTTDEVFVEFLLRAVMSDEEPRELADVVARYADSLARRHELILERDFVDGAIARLVPLSTEHRAAADARERAERAHADRQALAARVAARRLREDGLLSEHQARTDEAADAAATAEHRHRLRGAAVAELHRLMAVHLLERADRELAGAAAEVADAKLAARAWRETALVAKLRAATAAVRQRQALVSSTEEQAKPALQARNAAARALARGLLALAHEAAGRARDERALALSKAKEAEKAQAEQDRALAEAAAGAARAEQWDGRIAEVAELVAAAKQDGILGALETARTSPIADARGDAGQAGTATVAGAAARDVAATTAQELADAERAADEIEARHEAATAELDSARQRLRVTEEEARRAAREHADAIERTQRLADEPRFAELLDTEEVLLEYDVIALIGKLRSAIVEAERERTALHLAEASDEQARLALDDGQLLPPAPPIAEACRALDEAGITAWAGWDYLATIEDVAARREIADRVPELATGVLVNDAAQLPKAKQVLAERRLLPTTFVGVSTTAALRESPASTVDFVVPLNPALYDLDAAAVVQAAIHERHVERLERLARLEANLAADNAHLRELEAWRSDFPSGRLLELETRSQSTADAHATAAAAVRERGDVLGRLAAQRAELRQRIPALRTTVRTATERQQRLAALAEQEARIPEWTVAAARAREEVSRESERAATARRLATARRAEATEHQRAADGHERTAEQARADLRDVPGGGAVSPDEPVPAEPVDVLRETFRAAADAYDLVEVGADLRAGLEQAEREESAARAEVEALPPEVRALAEPWLETPEGADASTRAAARDRADRRLAAAEEQHTAAVAVRATRKADLEHRPAPAELPGGFRPPRDVEHGHELLRAATAALDAAGLELDAARAAHAAVGRAAAGVQKSAEAFQFLVDSMGAVEPADEPFEGDATQARDRYHELRAAWAAAQDAASAADDRVRAAADELSQYATARRFEPLDTPVRQQIVSVRRTGLPEYAAEWAEALRPRLRTLTDDLAQIDRHRSGIVTRLHGMVEAALRTLRTAQRVSRLPDGLGDWSGQEFLRIAFTPLDDALLVDRLGDVVDEAASQEIKRDGMSLLLRGVQVGVPKGFRVDLLKPDSVLRTERERVSEVKDVFSGGQQLTAAIILYCTMAALRANNRGRVRDRHAGVLFLDNPIGRASAGYLLELQRSVATALGVQLIYTTGLFDAGALSEFPLIIRLRNDADLRAGRKYLAVDDTIRRELDALDEPADDGQLSAVRMYVT